jgi:16S rRNA G966 N2-methylase RsmD
MKVLPNKKQKNLIKFGTIWQLGEHKLAYGDCRDPELLKKLIGKEKINLIALDPPFAVAVTESKRGFQTLVKDKAIANDHLQSDEEYKIFTQSWLDVIKPFLARKNSV